MDGDMAEPEVEKGEGVLIFGLRELREIFREADPYKVR